MTNQLLWQPSKKNIQQAHLTHFIEQISQQYHITFKNYVELHQWSVDHKALFWKAVWDYCQIKSSQSSKKIYTPGKTMRDTQWFAGCQLNFAENLLKRKDEQIALLFANEKGERRSLTYIQLHEQVACVADFLRQQNIQPGDRVVGFLPNIPEAVIIMLATASIGAIWSCCSPDFGLEGLQDRFGQIEPKILFAIDGHYYNGKTFNHLEKIQLLQQQLPQLQKTVIVPYVNKNPEVKNNILFSNLFNNKNAELKFIQLPFNHPLYIMYTSGTTGKPKCIVHGAGGTLIQHVKELILHSDLHADDKIFFYTTTGWMMWNWLISSLAAGATVVLYDGATVYPNPAALYDLIDEFGITIFGVGAKFLEMSEKNNLEPNKTHDLSSLKSILTTGSPLLPQSFNYVYEKIKTDVRLSSCSGGTDIISCFALGNPLLPVYRSELQCMGLGMDIHIYDENGHDVKQQKGELICASAFPSMPIYFWNDPDGEKYFHAYFDKFPNVWTHGDYAEITEHNGLIIYGRSDTTLNPSGVRIGTAEIYRQLEKFDEIIDCVAVGQEWQSSERIILFVTLRNQQLLTENLVTEIKNHIRQTLSPMHVPAKIIPVPDLPRTLNGKIVELAVKQVINGETIKNITALANPESLNYFKNIPWE